MGQLLEEKTGGRLNVEVFHSAQLGEEKDTIEQTRFGVIDLNRVTMAPFNNLIPETAIPSLPFLFRVVDHMHTVHGRPDRRADPRRPSSRTTWSRSPSTTPARAPSTTRKKPINSIADMKGMKFRVIQSDIFVDMVAALGANADADALRRGLFGARDRRHRRRREQLAVLRILRPLRGREVLHARRAHDVARGAGDVEGAPATSSRPRTRRSSREAAKDSVALRCASSGPPREKESEEKVRAAGVEVIADIDKQPFVDAMKPVYDKYVSDARS